MRARGLRPNRVTYSALINACGRAGQLARAFQTLDEMVSAGIEPNVITWTTLIDACGKGKVSNPFCYAFLPLVRGARFAISWWDVGVVVGGGG